MKPIIIIKVIIFAVLATLLMGCDNCGSGNFSVGAVEGPDAINEGAQAEYKVKVENGTSVSYQWAVAPASAGTFTAQTSPVTLFEPACVTENTQITIQVTVNDSIADPVVKFKDVDIIEADGCCPDNEPPAGEIIDCPTGTVTTPQITMNLTGSDNCTDGVDLNYEWKGFRNGTPINDWTLLPGAILSITDLENGYYDIHINAIDEAGNKGFNDGCGFPVDLGLDSPPDTSIVSGCVEPQPHSYPPGTEELTFEVTGTDDLTDTGSLTYEWAVWRNGVILHPWTGTPDTSILVGGLTDGAYYTFKVRAVDSKPQVDLSPAQCEFIVESPCDPDELPPDTQIVSGCNNYPAGTTLIKLGVTGSDPNDCTPPDQLHYEWQLFRNYSVLMQPWVKTYSTPISIYPLYSGSWQVQVRAVDSWNNKDETPDLCEFNIG